jgi:uncharacterized membrane protein YqjE
LRAAVNLIYALPRMLPLLARHALGYVDLATEDLEGLLARMRRRMLAAVTCILSTFLAVVMGCGLAIAIAWETPYRYMVIASLTLFFLAVAIATGDVARRERRHVGQLFQRLRDEWTRDRAALREIIEERTELNEQPANLNGERT